MIKSVSVFLGLIFITGTAFAAEDLMQSHAAHPVLQAETSASSHLSYDVAKAYFLPDYQQQIGNVSGDKSVDRVYDPGNNRTAGCPSGTYSSPLNKDRYNCTPRDIELSGIHKACYSCTPKPCGSGVIQSACNTANGYTWVANGYYSGENRCGNCNPNNCSAYKKKSECITSNGYTYTQKCKSAGVDYGTCTPNSCSGVAQSSCNTNCYTFTSNGCKSAGVIYGTCTAKTCPAGYTAGITSCSTGYKLSSSGCSGAQSCGKCTANTCSGTTEAQCYARTNGSKGWSWAAGSCNSAGTQYGTCTAKSCPSGYTPGKTSCGSGYTLLTSGYSGEQTCGKCVKNCPDGYDTGTTICGKGYYLLTTVPESFKLCGKCEDCGSEFCKTTTGCAENSYITSASQCGTKGAVGWELGAPTKQCGNTTYSFCQKIGCDTYGDASYVTKSQCTGDNVFTGIGKYSGDEECGSCQPACYVCPTQTGCLEGVLNVYQCGKTGPNGWWLDYTCSVGTSFYYKCYPNGCKNGGYVKGGLNCGPSMTWIADTAKYGYSGDAECGSCRVSCSMNDIGWFYNYNMCTIFTGDEYIETKTECGKTLCRVDIYGPAIDVPDINTCKYSCDERAVNGNYETYKQKEHDLSLCNSLCNSKFRY